MQRLAFEKDLLEKYFRNKVTWIDPKRQQGQTKVEVQVTCSNGKQYTLRVYIPSDYPESCPDMVVITSSKLRGHDGSYLEDAPNYNYIGRTRDGYTGILHHASREDRFRSLITQYSEITDLYVWESDNTLYRVFVKGLVWLEAYEAHIRTGQPLWHDVNKEQKSEMFKKLNT